MKKLINCLSLALTLCAITQVANAINYYKVCALNSQLYNGASYKAGDFRYYYQMAYKVHGRQGNRWTGDQELIQSFPYVGHEKCTSETPVHSGSIDAVIDVSVLRSISFPDRNDRTLPILERRIVHVIPNYQFATNDETIWIKFSNIRPEIKTTTVRSHIFGHRNTFACIFSFKYDVEVHSDVQGLAYIAKNQEYSDPNKQCDNVYYDSRQEHFSSKDEHIHQVLE